MVISIPEMRMVSVLSSDEQPIDLAFGKITLAEVDEQHRLQAQKVARGLLK